MGKQITSSPAPRTAAEYRAAIDDLLTEMKRMDEQSDRNWTEIERLKAESAAIRAETDKLIAQLDAKLDALEALLQPC
jgi:hypothetical protein